MKSDFYKCYLDPLYNVRHIYLCSRVEPSSERWKDTLAVDLTLVFPAVTVVTVDSLKFLVLYSHFLVPMCSCWLHNNCMLAIEILEAQPVTLTKMEEATLQIYKEFAATDIKFRSYEECSTICKQDKSITLLPNGDLAICERFSQDKELVYKPNFGCLINRNKQNIEKWFDFLEKHRFEERFQCASAALRLLLGKQLSPTEILDLWCPYLAYKYSGSLFTPNHLVVEAMIDA